MTRNVPAQVGQPDKSEAPKPITKNIRAAIDALVIGDVKTITAAAEKVGIARETLSRALNKPHVAEYMHQKVLRHLATASARAGAVKVDLLNSENQMVKDRASSFILGLAGIAPASQPSVNLNIEVRAGYVIDLSDDPAPAPKVIDHV